MAGGSSDASLPWKGEGLSDLVMATNNSSIVSKRSVERLYYANEQHFFRHFVKKPQRRSPLINRGYWLRMKAIDHVVELFLNETPAKQKIIVNLGCGYDPLPFQFLSRCPSACAGAKFVDVDFPPLMAKKCRVIEQNEHMQSLLTNLGLSNPEETCLLRSDQYMALGCDLRDLVRLSACLDREIDRANCMVLFVAEVSLTYMNVASSDALIRWTADFGDARFCLLEQCLPEGDQHPFARTMIAHFNKLQTPLQALEKYPRQEDHKGRLEAGGWRFCTVQSLWSLWGDPNFIGKQQRISLDKVEPFDEWEELALFASHYFLLYAQSSVPGESSRDKDSRSRSAVTESNIQLHIEYQENPHGQGCRRFGATVPIDQKLLAHHGGMGTPQRMSSSDVYGASSEAFYKVRTAGCPRMCHTITSVGKQAHLLVGGRQSPDNALADCWLYDACTNAWEECEPLQRPRYRHCATAIDGNSVVVFGGKDGSGVTLTSWTLWSREGGWQNVLAHDPQPKARFGASMIATTNQSGILVGGMAQEGFILDDFWEWTITRDEDLHISFRSRSGDLTRTSGAPSYCGRFGATLVQSSWGLVMLGGICSGLLLSAEDEILLLSDDLSVQRLRSSAIQVRPLLIGCSFYAGTDRLMILGGGAVCFSFGTYWNKGTWNLSGSESKVSPWRFQEESPTIGRRKGPLLSDNGVADRRVSQTSFTALNRVRICSNKEFEDVVRKGQPAILERCDIGSCVRRWSSAYLRDQVGAGRPVVVHEADTEYMDFRSKNFSYRTQPFGEFLDRVDRGERLYLRSIAAHRSTERPTKLSEDFPELANDFKLPPELGVVSVNAHSSPLRISGPVTMWLHYDVMANVLCQVRGAKRLLLFPPSDMESLGFPPGSSSSSLNCFTASYTGDTNLHDTHPHEAMLKAGDILFIPALWPHTASPTEGLSVAVNVFFRSLQTGYSAGKDVYGNRDLQAYENGRMEVAKMVRAFESLPVDVGRFYLKRLAAELMQKAEELGT